MKIQQNDRGFDYSNFKDHYGKECSLQKSSLATKDCIWLGVDDAEPQILCSQAAKFGVEPLGVVGWQPYPIPKEVLLKTHMHLTREQVANLLPVLKRFVDTGELS